MARQRASGGRPSKGNREALLTRTHPDLAAAVRDEADRLGLTFSDYIANVLADRHGFPHVGASANEAQMQLSA